jgi:hypothetical protein
MKRKKGDRKTSIGKWSTLAEATVGPRRQIWKSGEPDARRYYGDMCYVGTFIDACRK